METPNYYGPHFTKRDYDHAFNNALQWALGEGSEEIPLLLPESITLRRTLDLYIPQTIYRLKNKQRNSEGVYNKHGGNNKILNEAQEEAIRQYCYI